MTLPPPLPANTSSWVRLDTTPAPAQRPISVQDADQFEGRTGSVAAGLPAEGAVELLRLRVPAQHRAIWLEAERAIWEPWLQRQPGFLGRDLFWDPLQEHGVLVIRWASRQLWHAIPATEVSRVHQAFQWHARELLRRAGHRPEGQGSGPCSEAADCFPLLHAGEADPEPPHTQAD